MQIDNKPIKSSIGEIQNLINDFLTSLRNITVPSREEVILQEYRKKIEITAPWVSELNFIPAQKLDGLASLTTSDGKKLKRDELLEQISNNPAEKTRIINEFLSLFPDISVSDRTVLLNFMKELPPQQLEVEFQKICELFSTE
ncbi:MAG: hypothetical protein DRO88_02150 [Promethearchaeia archaeon]|nr:MAG: hypothetical protein DRO88_02150 [Candidatus Lokiarchaeia archaeon]